MSRKSIADIMAFARVASHAGPDTGERIADGIDVIFVDGTAGRYPAAGMREVISACQDLIMDAIIDDPLAPPTTPIIAMYDLPYTLALSWRDLAASYDLKPTAKAPGDVYSIRVERKGDGRQMAILFDMRHIMPRGITGMGEVIGMERDGTPLTDCRIMRAYYAHVSESRKLWDPERGDRLGASVLTLTGLARDEVRSTLSPLNYNRKIHGRMVARSLGKDYALDAAREAASTYGQYATRRAVTRGGFAFISAKEAGRVHGRTISIDETSAYHAQVMCRYIPEGFSERSPEWLQAAAERIVSKSPAAVMAAYHMPWTVYIHAEMEFKGLRLRPGTVFAEQEIGLESTARLYATSGIMGIDAKAAMEAERGVRGRGYGDTIAGGVYAFSKVMEAERLTTWVTEQELWCMSQVYTWESMRAIRGEGATKRKRPDDLSILTSMHFWREKQGVKAALRREEDSERKARMAGIYAGEVKPKFNAVGYGLHARDEYRPNWTIDEEGAWHMEEPLSPEDFDKRKPKRPKAWLNYGIRIAGGARVHLILAMQLIWQAFGDKARIIAGDTDSLKIRTDLDPLDIVAALEPLHKATRSAIDRVTSRAWSLFPERCEDMEGVGEFEVEDGGICDAFYAPNLKQYCTWDKCTGAVALTLAGVPRELPGVAGSSECSYGAWLRLMVARYSPRVLERVFTWGVVLSPAVSQLTTIDMTDADPETGRLPRRAGVEYTLDDPLDPENAATIRWQKAHGRHQRVDGIATAIWRDGAPVFVYTDGEL